MNEVWLLAMAAQIEALHAEIAGMQAENQRRISEGAAISYGAEAFNKKAQELRSISDDLMRNR